MTTNELIALLKRADPTGNCPVRLMLQPSWPFEHGIAGVATSDDVQNNDIVDDGAADAEAIVYIVEGTQFCYGSKRAWDCAARR